MKVWAYIHPKLKILCCALLPEAVPDGVEALELDVESPDDVILENGQIRVKTAEEKLIEKLQKEKERKLGELDTYISDLLSQTDYIIIKIAEAQTLGDLEKVEELKRKYAKDIQQRQELREWSRKMKEAIKKATTSEELSRIGVRYV